MGLATGSRNEPRRTGGLALRGFPEAFRHAGGIKHASRTARKSTRRAVTALCNQIRMRLRAGRASWVYRACSFWGHALYCFRFSMNGRDMLPGMGTGLIKPVPWRGSQNGVWTGHDYG